MFARLTFGRKKKNGPPLLTYPSSYSKAFPTYAGGRPSIAPYPVELEHLDTVKVDVFAYTFDPTIAWELLKPRNPVKTLKPMKLDTPVREDYVRLVCISDIHGKHKEMKFNIPDGDILIVAGDFTTCGHPREIRDFNTFLGTLPHRYKVVIAGNHELTLDQSLQRSKILKTFNSKHAELRKSISNALEEEGLSDVRQLLSSCVYLEDCAVEIYGIKIYGTPWQPAFDNWAFNVSRGQACLDKWNQIPPYIDVLVSHTPPLGHGDLTRIGQRAGCVELLNCVRKRIRPKYHIFGHIHEGYGCTTDGYTKFINASICDFSTKPVNAPILFDLPLPHGYQK